MEILPILNLSQTNNTNFKCKIRYDLYTASASKNRMKEMYNHLTKKERILADSYYDEIEKLLPNAELQIMQPLLCIESDKKEIFRVMLYDENVEAYKVNGNINHSIEFDKGNLLDLLSKFLELIKEAAKITGTSDDMFSHSVFK